MNDNKFSLEKYSGRASRHQCPNCGDPHSFTYYIDEETGRPIDESCGRCNHESSCGYHYTPKQFFIDNPTRQERACVSSQTRRTATTRPKPQEPSFIPFEYVEKSASYASDFMYFLCGLFEAQTIERLMEDYALGATRSGDVIFWQIDKLGKVRTGKVMRYDKNTGHRVHGGGGVNWVHSLMKCKDFNLKQCLFGEHLLKMYPDKTVALVESEKSALLGAAVLPQYVWLATGGKSNMNPDKMKVLRGRTVTLFPDAGCYEDWSERAKTAGGEDWHVSDIIERSVTDEERAKGIDVGNWIIRSMTKAEPTAEETEPERFLRMMIQKNGKLATLIDTFNLELAG